MLRYLKKWGKGQQGQAMAEFALVFPIMVIILVASLEFGWYYLNYNAVNQYARDTLVCVPEPQGNLVWEGGDWKDIKVSKPSWMTAEDLTVLYSDTYDGWIAFDDQASHFYPTFNYNVSQITTILNKNQMKLNSVRGGWLVSAMALKRPMTGMRPEEEQRYAGARTYRYADIEVEVSYTFHPLTALGEMFFCKDGQDTCEIVVKERAEIEMGQNLNTGGT